MISYHSKELLSQAFPKIRPRTQGIIQPLEELNSTPASEQKTFFEDSSADVRLPEQFSVRRDSQISGLHLRFVSLQKEIKQNGASRAKCIQELDAQISLSLNELSPKNEILVTWIERRLDGHPIRNSVGGYGEQRQVQTDTGYWDEKISSSDGSMAEIAAKPFNQSDNSYSFPTTKRVFDSLNTLNNLCDTHEERFQLIDAIDRFYITIQCTSEWIVRNYHLLLSTDELGTDLNSLVQLQRKLLGWESDMEALSRTVAEVGNEVQRLTRELRKQAPSRRDLYLTSDELKTAEEVKYLGDQLAGQWNSLQRVLQDRQEKFLVSAELQQFLQVRS